MITFITGPGTHAHLIIRELIETKNDFQVAQYWPYPSIVKYKKGSQKRIIKLKIYQLINHIIWGVFSKLKLTKGNNRHLDLIFTLYDLVVSGYLSKTDLLISWPQTSLHAMRKIKNSGGKVYLEYPMIHIDEYLTIMNKEYEKWKIPLNNTNNLFSGYMANRMREEILIADKIILLSTFARNSFIKHGVPEEKIIIRNLTIDPLEFLPDPSLIENKYIVLYAGRIDLLKGIHYLIMAFSELSIPDSELWLAGAVSNEIQPFLEKYPNENVKLLGYQNISSLINLYQRASVFVLPSIQESFGMVIPEAMSCGLPVIGSVNSGAPDLIEHGKDGFIYDPFNLKDLIRHLNYLYDNPDKLLEFRVAARNKILILAKEKSKNILPL